MAFFKYITRFLVKQYEYNYLTYQNFIFRLFYLFKDPFNLSQESEIKQSFISYFATFYRFMRFFAQFVSWFHIIPTFCKLNIFSTTFALLLFFKQLFYQVCLNTVRMYDL